MNNSISRHNITTKENNQIQVFYNPDNNLLVIDLVDKNESGGNELLRITLNEKELLAHCNKFGVLPHLKDCN
jgi:hypothetical protein